MLDYFNIAIVNAFRQVIGGFGLTIILAYLMWLFSQHRRGMGQSRFGMAYYYFVSPGVMFHEFGHLLGCWLTLTPVSKTNFFGPSEGTLGYVIHAKPRGMFGYLKNFIIATGPVWLGCLAIFLLGIFVAHSDFLPACPENFKAENPGLLGYVVAVASEGFCMLLSFITEWQWTSALHLFLFYLLFCVTSEIALSTADLAGIWQGFFILIVFIILLNLIPGFNFLMLKLSDFCLPAFYYIHSIMMFVLFLDIALFFFFKLLLKLLPGKKCKK